MNQQAINEETAVLVRLLLTSNKMAVTGALVGRGRTLHIEGPIIETIRNLFRELFPDPQIEAQLKAVFDSAWKLRTLLGLEQAQGLDASAADAALAALGGRREGK